MNYCTVCKKFVSDLGYSYLRVCIPQEHRIKDITYDDLYNNKRFH